MAQIPVYDQKIGLESGGTPTPQLSNLPSSASGENITEAIGGLGKAVGSAAEAAGHIVAYKMKLDAQEKVDTLAEQAASELQNHLHGDGGLLTRQGDAAKGITAGDPFVGPKQGPDNGIKYKDTFDGFSAALREKYLAQATTDFERHALARAIGSHERVLRNAVISHESQQARIARADASEAKIKALENTGVDAATVGDLQHVIDEGMSEREKALRIEGHSDETVINAVKTKTADDFATAAVHANLERDPEAAQALFDGVKDKISGITSAKLQDQIDGKMIAIRSDAIWKDIASNPNNRTSDGMIDLGKAEKIAGEMAVQRPERERMHYIKMAKEQTGIANTALRQQKEQSTRGYLDGFSELRDKNIPFQEAEKLVMSKYGGIFGPSELDKLREQAVKVYQRDPDMIEARLNVMLPEQKRGYADAVNIIKTKYKNQTSTIPGEELPVKLSDAMIQQLKSIAPKMTREQIMEWTNSQLKDVPTKPGYLGFLTGKTPEWQEQHSLITRYGSAKVAEASAAIRQAKGSAPTYVELEARLRGR